ncbi:hypothetical protein D3C87_18040 [compost metagenome]
MKNLFAFRKGLAIGMISIVALSACQKEKLPQEVSDKQTQNQSLPQTDYKYSSVVKIQGETVEDGYLNLTISSNDENYLKMYVAKLEQSKITLEEANLLSDGQEEKPDPFMDTESDAGVSLKFDWSNFEFDLEKGKLYGIYLMPKEQDNSKALVLYSSMSNVVSFSSAGNGFAAVNVNSTQPGFQFGCLCTTQSRWKFANHQGNDFYERLMSNGDNLEVRTFTCKFVACYFDGFGISSVPYFGANPTYYRPRFNYSSPELPENYMDYNDIKSGRGINTYTNQISEKATVTFYLAG